MANSQLKYTFPSAAACREPLPCGSCFATAAIASYLPLLTDHPGAALLTDHPGWRRAPVAIALARELSNFVERSPPLHTFAKTPMHARPTMQIAARGRWPGADASRPRREMMVRRDESGCGGAVNAPQPA